MRQENEHDLYTSPEVEVMEVKAGQVICTSGLTLGSLEEVDEEW